MQTRLKKKLRLEARKRLNNSLKIGKFPQQNFEMGSSINDDMALGGGVNNLLTIALKAQFSKAR